MTENNPEFDQTPPAPGKAQFRVQRVDCSWSEWRDVGAPIPEEHILSVMVSENMTKAQYAEFMKQFEIGETS